MSQTLLNPLDSPMSVGTGRWMVTIFNNDYSTFPEVISALMRATGCDNDEAVIEAWEAHTFGKTPVHFAGKDVCDDVALTITSAGIKTEVSREWEE